MLNKCAKENIRPEPCSDDDNLAGIYEGRLFYLVQSVAQDKTDREVERLKGPLFERLFGAPPILKDSGGKTKPFNYCVPKGKWEEILKGAKK